MRDIGIIGAGPAGYVAAIKAAQNGLSVVLFEKNLIGGTCLNRGCIPTKTLLHACNVYNEIKNSAKLGITAENINIDFEKIQEHQKNVTEKIRKSLTSLIKSYGIEIVEECAVIDSEHVIKTSSNKYEVKNIIIATGSKPNKIKFNGNYPTDFVLTSDDILEIKTLPKTVLIVGSGAIGIEWARILSAFGCKVIITEIMDSILPIADYEVSERIARIFKRNRIDFYTGTSVAEINDKTVTLSNGKIIECDKILLGAGRIPDTDFGQYSSNIKINKYIETDSTFKTNINNIFAIGDVNGYSMLAHSASKQAEQVIDYILGREYKTTDKNIIPSVIYGSPEIAFIGKTEQLLKKENIEYKKGFFPISALGRAFAEDKIEGFIKILSSKNGQILGAHIISQEASAMIEQIAIAMTNNITADNLLNVVFAHPTYSEGIAESLLALDNKAVNLPKMK